MHDNDIDIIGLSETQLDDRITDTEVLIEGFTIFRNDRNVSGGGVAIYVKDSLPLPKIIEKSDKLELLSLEIKQQNARPFFLVCWYRPPTPGVDDVAFEDLRGTISELDKAGKETILIGDTNCDFKNSADANTKQLKHVYSEFQIEQLIKQYTRVAVTTNKQGEQRISKSLIDHFSTSSPKYILETNVLETGMVDHYLVYGVRKINAWRLNKKSNKPKIVESRTMKKYDKALFQQDLQQVDWEAILTPFANNPSAMAGTFQEIFESILSLHAPIRKRRVRSEFAPWLTPNLRKSMETRDKLKQLARKSPEMWPAYTKQRNQVTKEIKYSIQDYYKGLIEKNKGDSKKMWRTIN